jgi:hypothetical protein
MAPRHATAKTFGDKVILLSCDVRGGMALRHATAKTLGNKVIE